MVRFYWHVDDGCSAHVPVNGIQSGVHGIQHLSIDMDLPGVAGSAHGILTLPPEAANGAASGKVKSVGVIIAHDHDASGWQGNLMRSIVQVYFLYLGLVSNLRFYSSSLASKPDIERAVECSCNWSRRLFD
jgi:hypothetical protein